MNIWVVVRMDRWVEKLWHPPYFSAASASTQGVVGGGGLCFKTIKWEEICQQAPVADADERRVRDDNQMFRGTSVVAAAGFGECMQWDKDNLGWQCSCCRRERTHYRITCQWFHNTKRFPVSEVILKMIWRSLNGDWSLFSAYLGWFGLTSYNTSVSFIHVATTELCPPPGPYEVGFGVEVKRAYTHRGSGAAWVE